MHGGASTGPRTAEGRKRIAAAHFKHGRRLRSVIAEQIRRNPIGREINAEVAAIEREAIVRGWLAKGCSEGAGAIRAEQHVYSSRLVSH